MFRFVKSITVTHTVSIPLISLRHQ